MPDEAAMPEATLAERPKKRRKEAILQMRADVEWLARIDAEADRHNLSRAAWVRMVLTRELERAETARGKRPAPEEG
jgi:hypothetical protein